MAKGEVEHKGGLNTPFTSAIFADTSTKGTPGSVIDRNVCEHFSKPRAVNHDGDPEVFFTGVNGKDYHGKIEGATPLSSPMQGMKTPSDPRK